MCGSREYERVVVRRRDGKPYDTAFFACMGCTTMFGDPTKYSAPPPPLKVTRIDAPVSFRRSPQVGRFKGASEPEAPAGSAAAGAAAAPAAKIASPAAPVRLRAARSAGRPRPPPVDG